MMNNNCILSEFIVSQVLGNSSLSFCIFKIRIKSHVPIMTVVKTRCGNLKKSILYIESIKCSFG